MGSIVVRKTAKGHARYQAHVRRKGQPALVKTFTSKTRASRWITRQEAAIEEQRDLPQREATKRSLAGEVKRYVEDEGFANLSAGEQTKRAMHLQRWCEALGPITVADLTPAAIRTARTKIKAKGGRGRKVSSATLNRYLATLTTFCSFLVKQELLTTNPASAKKVDRGPERERILVLTPDERRRLLDACLAESPRLHALVTLGFTTGGRRDTELLSLKWSEVDLRERRVRFLRTKNGEPRSLPLPEPAVEVLTAMKKVRHLDGSVFGPEPFPEQAWRRVRKAVGLDQLPAERVWKDAEKSDPPDRLREHDLRHCYATALAQAGATLSELKHALGHKTLSQVLRYQHLCERSTENAIRDRLQGVDLA